MKTFICIITLFLVSPALKSQALPDINASDKTQMDPVAVVRSVFDAARTGKLDQLSGLCDPSARNDQRSRTICEIPTADAAARAEFMTLYATGTIVGTPLVDNNKALVKIRYGQDAGQSADVRLVRVSGRWYLLSF